MKTAEGPIGSRERVLDLILSLAALAILFRAPIAVRGEDPNVLIFWYGLVMLTSLLHLPLSLMRGGENISPGAAVVFAIGLLQGPVAAGLAGALNGLVLGLLAREARAVARLRMVVRRVIAAAGGAFIFQTTGGFAYPGLANSLFDLSAVDLAPVMLASLTHFGITVLTGGLYASIKEGISLRRVLQASARGTFLTPFSFLLVGFLMAVVYIRVGWGITLLFLISLLVTHASHQRRIQLEEARDGAIRALTSTIDARDPYTRGHSDRIARYAVLVGRRMMLPESTVQALEVAARLHDLGKVTIDPRVLGKPASLAPEEEEMMHRHAEAGAEVMSRLTYLEEHADMVRFHHERPDGKGYPLGLSGEQIPLGARIIAVVDAFDAMTSDRPYRRALPVERAVEEMVESAGTAFDSEVVDVMVELVRSGAIAPVNGNGAVRRDA